MKFESFDIKVYNLNYWVTPKDKGVYFEGVDSRYTSHTLRIIHIKVDLILFLFTFIRNLFLKNNFLFLLTYQEKVKENLYFTVNIRYYSSNLFFSLVEII